MTFQIKFHTESDSFSVKFSNVQIIGSETTYNGEVEVE